MYIKGTRCRITLNKGPHDRKTTQNNSDRKDAIR